MLPEVGIHIARIGDQPLLVDRANEDPPAVGLQLWLPCEVAEGDDKGKRITAIRTLVTKDGVVQINEWSRLQEIFGGYTQPTEMFAQSEDHSEKRFEIDVQDDEWNGKVTRKVKWINKVGGSGMRMPTATDDKSILAKYGAQFRALAGGLAVPAAAKTVPPKSPPTKVPAGKKSAPPKAPPSNVKPGTMEQAWEAVCNANDGKSQAEITQIWFDLLREKFNTDNNSEVTPEGWGKLIAFVEDNLPF